MNKNAKSNIMKYPLYYMLEISNDIIIVNTKWIIIYNLSISLTLLICLINLMIKINY
jgi:hypothetical protein